MDADRIKKIRVNPCNPCLKKWTRKIIIRALKKRCATLRQHGVFTKFNAKFRPENLLLSGYFCTFAKAKSAVSKPGV